MTIGDKWASLFHHVLERDENVTPELACEALALIEWLVSKWREYMALEGYDPDPALVKEIDMVVMALQARASGTGGGTEPWPTSIFRQWELSKPFHMSLDPALLKSSWDELCAAMKRDTNVDDAVRQSSEAYAIWVLSGFRAIQLAWEKVLRILLPKELWTVDVFGSVGELPGQVLNGERTLILLGSTWDASDFHAALQHWHQGQPSGPNILHSSDVAGVLVRCNQLSEGCVK